MNRITIAAALLLVSVAGNAAASDGPALCPSADQRDAAAKLLTNLPVSPVLTAQLAAGLKTSEAAAAATLPADWAYGVSGASMLEVWESLTTWPKATVLIAKAGHVFEVHGRIPAGAPSTQSRFFNLEAGEAGLGGHLRPDLTSAIYVYTMNSAHGPIRGLMFFDMDGAAAFGVFLPEGQSSDEMVAAFERTRDAMRQLAPLCGAG